MSTKSDVLWGKDCPYGLRVYHDSVELPDRAPPETHGLWLETNYGPDDGIFVTAAEVRYILANGAEILKALPE